MIFLQVGVSNQRDHLQDGIRTVGMARLNKAVKGKSCPFLPLRLEALQ